MAVFLIVNISACSQDNAPDDLLAQGKASVTVKIPGLENRKEAVNAANKSNFSSNQQAIDNANVPAEIDSIIIDILDSRNNVLDSADALVNNGEVTLTINEGRNYTVRGRGFNGNELLFSGQVVISRIRVGINLSVNITLEDQIQLTLNALNDLEIDGLASNVNFNLQGLTNINVRWYINGVEGGSVEFGFIDTAGAYTPPSILPAQTQILLTAEPVLAPSFSQSINFNLINFVAPNLTLLGNAVDNITQGSTYIDAGAIANDNEDGNITSNIVVNNALNINVPGTYNITYDVTDSRGLSANQIQRTINVVAISNTAPVLSLLGNNPETFVQELLDSGLGGFYIDAGASATDVEDGNLSSSIVVTNLVDTSNVGAYTVTYNVTDSNGQSATPITRTVNVIAPNLNAPVITLLGNAVETVLLNSVYTDAGASATDVEDGNISADIISNSTLDTNTLGSYSLTYNVNDSGGLSANQVTRTVNVVAAGEIKFVHKIISKAADASSANDNSDSVEMSADGRYFVYSSTATNITSGISNIFNADIFRFDRQADTTLRVNLSTAGDEANSFSSFPDVSNDGRYVVYSSFASNLVASDTNSTSDIFLRDIQTSTTTRISVDSAGGQSNGFSDRAKISGDGVYIAYQSNATNLVNNDTNGSTDIFLYNRLTGNTRRISVNSAGDQSGGASNTAFISIDGRYVVYTSSSNDLVTDDTNSVSDIFLFDTQNNSTIIVSRDNNNVEANGACDNASISDDGSLVAFRSAANNLVIGDSNSSRDIFVKNIQSSEINRVSVNTAGAAVDDFVLFSQISADKNFVVFSTKATNLTTENTAGLTHVYRHEISTGKTLFVSTRVPGGSVNNNTSLVATSANGNIIAFDSSDYFLTGADINARIDIFVSQIDTDGDGVSDADETIFGSNVLISEADHDNDGLTTNIERYFGSNPLDDTQQAITSYVLSELTSLSVFTAKDTVVTADINTTGDDIATEYTLPFSFPFYGANINKLKAGTNSDIKLLTGNAGSSADYTLTDSSRNGLAFISIFNDDLDSRNFGTGLSVEAKTNPTRVVFNWDTETNADSGNNLLNNFETILYPNGYIIFRYNTMNAINVSESGSGISLTNGADFVSISNQFAAVNTLAGRVFVFEPQHQGDADNDGIIDSNEAGFGTLLNNDDSDNDGFKDGFEVYIMGTDPMNNLDPSLGPL